MKRWLQRLMLGSLLLTGLGGVGLYWLTRISTAPRPPLPADTSILRLRPEWHGGKIWLGKSWVGQREGLTTVFLKGSALEMGYAKGVLLQSQIHTLETEFLEMVHSYVPAGWRLNLLKDYVIFRNRHLSDHVPLEYRVEILGATLGCPDIHPELGDYYNRVLNYHAAHDVSYLLIDNPLVARAGCTAFGVWGDATTNGHLITGRNFDWEAAEVFSRDRLVILCEPEGGIPFVSVAWAGMAGVVSGMNRAGLSVTINGAPSQLPEETATPVAMVARDVLQQAHNLAEALQQLRQAKVFVSTLWLIGSRVDQTFVVVEKTPTTTAVRESAGHWIICPNHFETPALREGKRNLEYQAEATSVARELRLVELLRQAAGKIDPATAVSFLRDRKLAGGAFSGNGHRASLNPLIATHATVMDLTAGIFWAAKPPKQLGQFVAYDVNDFSHELPEREVPADAMLESGEYDQARTAQHWLAAGQLALSHHDASAALLAAEQAESFNPGFYQNAALRGQALLTLARPEEAVQSFARALSEHPAFLREQQQLENWLKVAQRK